MVATKSRRFGLTVPRCSKGGPYGKPLMATPRGWVCEIHGGTGCAGRDQHLALREFRKDASADRVDQALINLATKYPDASTTELCDRARNLTPTSGDSVARRLGRLREAGLIEPRVWRHSVPVSPDFTVLDEECSHPVTICSYRGLSVEGMRCVECSTLLPL